MTDPYRIIIMNTCDYRDGDVALVGSALTRTRKAVFTFATTSFVQPSSPLMSPRGKSRVKLIPRIFRSISKSTDSEHDWNIRCIIQNDRVTFSIKLSRNYHINHIKSLVREQACHGVLRNVDSKDLAVCKVSTVFQSGSNNPSHA